MLFRRWMRFGILSSALVAIPAQNAFAFGGQWRPVNSVAPGVHSAEARAQRAASAAHARFRPINHLRKPQPLPQLAAPMVPPPPVRPMAPRAPQAPAFARQFSWHPAPTLWSRHNAAPSERQVQSVSPRFVRAGVSSAGWRPVAQTGNSRPVASVPVPVPVTHPSQGSWRPVADYGSNLEPATATTGSHPQAIELDHGVNAYNAPAPSPYAAYNAYANPYAAHPYMMPPMPLAGGYNPYPMPYMPAPFGAPFAGGYPPMMPPPPPPAWGWQPPMYMPVRPLYAPPPVPGLDRESSLAGCPGC